MTSAGARRSLCAALAPTLLVASLVVAPVQAADQPGRGGALLQTGPRVLGVIAGQALKITGTLPLRVGSAMLVLERRNSRTWRRIDKVQVVAGKRYKFVSHVPAYENGRLLKLRVRIQSPSVPRSRQTVNQLVAVVQEPVLDFELSSATDVGGTFTAAVLRDDRLSGHTLRVQVWGGESWSAVPDFELLEEGASADGLARVVVRRARSAPSWYRVVASSRTSNVTFYSEPLRTRAEREPHVIAHRGGGGEAPEGTVAALEMALRSRVRTIEADVRVTADGVPVIFHDANLTRTTDAEEVFPGRTNYAVDAFTLQELRRLSLGSWMDERFAAEGIVTLAEWLTLLRGRAAAQIEAKDPGPVAMSAMSEALSVLSPAERTRVTVSSFDLAWLRDFRSADLSVKLGVVTARRPSLSDLEDWAKWADEWAAPLRVLDKATIDAARSAGLGSLVYTVNSRTDMELAISLSPDAVVTDYPTSLLTLLHPQAPRLET